MNCFQYVQEANSTYLVLTLFILDVTNQDLAATNGLPVAAAAAAVDSDTGGIPGSISKDVVVKQVDNEALT